MRPEKLVLSMVISRFIRRAASVKRSIWKPSMPPPPSLGMACGAKVPSTPVRSGWAMAASGNVSATASAMRRRIIVKLPGVSRDRTMPRGAGRGKGAAAISFGAAAGAG